MPSRHTIAVCRSGHISEYLREAQNFNQKRILKDETGEGEMVVDRLEPVSNHPKHCPKCGDEVLSQCENCSFSIETVHRGNIQGDIEDRPPFCRGCGEDFPWTTTVESELSREGEFIELEENEVHGHFYPELLHEINLSYRVQADHAVLILNRKLIESLLIDILRGELGFENVEEFYDSETGQHLGLGQLIENLEENSDQFRKHPGTMDEEFFRDMLDLKHSGDASAHAIEEEVDENDLESKSETATRVAKVLFRVRKSVLTMHGSQS